MQGDEEISKKITPHEINEKTNVMTHFVLEAEKLETPFVQARGLPALFQTQESILNWQEWKDVRNRPDAPNGYLMVTGLSSGLADLYLFPDKKPKGLIINDIDPYVTILAKLLAETALKTNDQYAYLNLLNNREALGEQISGILEKSENKRLNEQVYGTKLSADHIFYNFHQNAATLITDINYEIRDIQEDVSVLKAGETLGDKYNLGIVGMKQMALGWISIPRVVYDNWQIFHQLALEGNLAVTSCDITDQRFLDLIAKLPEFDTLRNVIDVSNIVDHVTEQGSKLYNLPTINRLGTLFAASANSYQVDSLREKGYKKNLIKGGRQFTPKDVTG